MSDALRDVQRGEACVDEQGNVRVADIMRADLAHARCFAACTQLEEQVVARPLEQPPAGADVVPADVEADLIQQKLRDTDVADTLWRFR